jgi:glycosyltransferase involved in cell wall biosynthesis
MNPYQKKKIQVIYNGVVDLSAHDYNKCELQKKYGISDDTLVLGTISRLDPIKNHRMMLKAFSEIHQQYPHVKLLIVGDGELREILEDLCDKLAIREQVIFTGFIIEPQKYLNIMDVFLLPSLSEGTSMTLLEAMSFTKPCVVTNVGGNPEIVSHSKTGLVVPNDDCSALVNACVSLIKEPDKRQQLAIEGRQRYEKLFTVHTMMAQFESLYLSLSKND